MAFLSQYKTHSTAIFERSDRTLSIELSSKSIQPASPPKESSKDSQSEKATHTTKTSKPNIEKPSKPITPPLNNEEITPIQDLSQHQQPTQDSNKDKLYLQQIITAIENNKYYPNSARRRNMQETIRVSFNLLKNGEVEDIEISGKYKLLQLAAKNAIFDSLPFNTASNGITFPLRVSYSMAFKLN